MQNAYDVFLWGKEIDTVFYSPCKGGPVPADEVRRSLINHDGYAGDIVVKRRAKNGRHVETADGAK